MYQNDTTHPGLPNRFIINNIPTGYDWIYLARFYAICYNGYITMKLINVKIAKSVPHILPTMVIKTGHGLSSNKLKTQTVIFEHEGVIPW